MRLPDFVLLTVSLNQSQTSTDFLMEYVALMKIHANCSLVETLSLPISMLTIYKNSTAYTYSEKEEKQNYEKFSILIKSIGSVSETIANFGKAFAKILGKRR